MVSWISIAFSMIQQMLAIWSLFPLPFLKSWKFTVHILLKPGLENFEHFFTSVWDECNCLSILWHWFFFWGGRIGMKADLCQYCCHCWAFQICWLYWVQHVTASSFRIWNSSTGIPSPPLALFIVMLPKVHLASHFRMSSSRLMIKMLWLSWLWRFFICTVLLCILATYS